MSSIERLNRDLKRKACDVCKRRKVRCSGDNPCPNCIRHNVRCQYTSSHGRLAHSERRVANLQERIRMVELAWARFVPDIKLENAVHAVEHDKVSQLETDEVHHLTDSRDVAGSSEHDEQVSSSIDHPFMPTDLEQEDADALDWDETEDLTTFTDGIGSLSVSSKGIGYMGPQSGNALLRNLQSASMLYLSPYHDLPPGRSNQAEVNEDITKTSMLANQYIDWYFRYYHCAYPILHEGCFRAQIMGALPKPKDGSWPILLNTVLAIGAHSGSTNDQNTDLYFYRKAWQQLSWSSLQRGTLSLVQALSLLANYLQKRDRPNTAFTLLGVAMNMAQGIGLHRELSGPTTSKFTMEIRRRVWWTLFIFDSGARLTFGRPTLTLGGITAHLPQNLADEDLAVDIDELPSGRHEPTVSSSLIWQSKLAKISNLANEALLGHQLPDASFMLGLAAQIITWAKSLPDYMRADSTEARFEIFNVPRMVLLWRSMHLRVVIHRPFILDLIKRRAPLDLSDNNKPSTQCFQAAEECVSSILTFWNDSKSHHRSLTWYACYWLVTAIFVHVTCLLYDPRHVLAPAWRQYIENCKIAFEAMGTVESTAMRAALILDKITDLVPSSPDSTFLAINEPARMEMAEFWNQNWIDMFEIQTPFTSQT